MEQVRVVAKGTNEAVDKQAAGNNQPDQHHAAAGLLQARNFIAHSISRLQECEQSLFSISLV
jgi:hypothetical protein